MTPVISFEPKWKCVAKFHAGFLFYLEGLKIIQSHWKTKGIDRDRTRTCNPQIRSLVPYPLGHTVLVRIECHQWCLLLLPSTPCCNNLRAKTIKSVKIALNSRLKIREDIMQFFGILNSEWNILKEKTISQIILCGRIRSIKTKTKLFLTYPWKNISFLGWQNTSSWYLMKKPVQIFVKSIAQNCHIDHQRLV